MALPSGAGTITVERRAADVAVLGDSCVALAAAYSLARRGKKVVWLPDLGLTAPQPPPQLLRPLRLTHPDAAWVSLASESSAYWRGLAAQAAGGGGGAPLLSQCRSLELAPGPRAAPAGGWGGGGAGAQELLGRMQEACKAAGVRLGSLRSEELGALFPALRPHGLSPGGGGLVGLLQPEGGLLHAGSASSFLRSLCERQGVLLRDRLVLRGWRDAGSHFVLRASSRLLPGQLSCFEVEQLLLAPGEGEGEGGGWPRQALRMFGVDTELRVVPSSLTQCAAAGELSSLPLWRAIGLAPPPAAPASERGSARSDAAVSSTPGSGRGRGRGGGGGGGGDEEDAAGLHVVCGQPPQLGGSGGGGGGGGMAGASLLLSMGVAPADGDVTNPWTWQPGSAVDRRGLAGAHRLAGQLLRGVGPPLRPSSSSGPASQASSAAAAAGSSGSWGEVALHVATPDGWPMLGFLPGLEPGRALFACTASCAAGGGAGAGAGAPPTPAAPGAAAAASEPQSSGGGDGRYGRGAAAAAGGTPPAAASAPAAAGGGDADALPDGVRHLLYDGYQLSPLLAKMAADLLCGAARVAEAEPGRLDLGRAGLGACARTEGLDPWDGLGAWQSGEAWRRELAAAGGGGDEAAERERAEALARGGRMLLRHSFSRTKQSIHEVQHGVPHVRMYRMWRKVAQKVHEQNPSHFLQEPGGIQNQQGYIRIG